MRSCEAPALPAGPKQRDRNRRLEHTNAAPRPEVRWRARTGARAARAYALQKAAATLSTADLRAVR
eukprot:6318859-Prymnesium_polylepis.1